MRTARPVPQNDLLIFHADVSCRAVDGVRDLTSLLSVTVYVLFTY